MLVAHAEDDLVALFVQAAAMAIADVFQDARTACRRRRQGGRKRLIRGNGDAPAPARSAVVRGAGSGAAAGDTAS
jgi:hypothetical protein